MKVWVDHFSTYIYQKRGFYYFSRRVPKDVQPLHGKQRIVLALNTRSRAKALKHSQAVRRIFTTVKAVINLAITEHRLDIRNAFSAIYMPEAESKKRVSIPVETISQIQQSCMEHDDDMRWLIALISDTGMRLAEAAGLHVDDIKLDEDIPYADIKPHPWRSLKTKGRQRQVPLVGASLWAAQRIKANASSCFAFPRYTNNSRCNANSVSNALNKWLHANLRKDIVIHGFRHAMRDRLRAVSCPSEMIDQIGGWSSRKVGEGYGGGYSVLQTKQWMTRSQLNQNQGRTL